MKYNNLIRKIQIEYYKELRQVNTDPKLATELSLKLAKSRIIRGGVTPPHT